MRVRFTVDALAHISAIRFHIGEYSRRAANHVVERIYAETDRLGDFPHLGHRGQVPDTYEWTVPGLPYVIVYEFGPVRQVVVLGVYHGAQNR
jgi:toxin ParE1/3/4